MVAFYPAYPSRRHPRFALTAMSSAATAAGCDCCLITMGITGALHAFLPAQFWLPHTFTVYAGRDPYCDWTGTAWRCSSGFHCTSRRGLDLLLVGATVLEATRSHVRRRQHQFCHQIPHDAAWNTHWSSVHSRSPSAISRVAEPAVAGEAPSIPALSNANHLLSLYETF